MVTLGAGLQADPHTALPPDMLDGLVSSQVLEIIETMESLKAWVECVSLAATGVLASREARAALIQAGPDASATERAEAVTGARTAAADELILATGMSLTEARWRVNFATASTQRVAGLRQRLCSGSLSWQRARVLHEECQDRPAAKAAAIADEVLAPVRGGVALSQGLFRKRLSRCLARGADPDTARRHALDRRYMGVTLEPDGTGEMTVTGGAIRMRGAYERVDAIARRLRAAGSTRTLAQLRADITLDLILFGQLHGSSGPAAGQDGCTATAATPPDRAHATQPGAAFGIPPTTAAEARVAAPSAGSQAPASPIDPDDPADPADPDSLLPSFQGWRFGERLPVAQVMITISAASLLGVDDEPGLVAGGTAGDYLHAVLIRDAAYAAGSTWWRLITDPKDGSLQDLSSKGYRPSPALARAVQARDGVCRAPGCCVPAAKCDLDHDVPWPAGATTYANLSAKHRRHHNHKTRRRWRASRDGDVITWVTGAGRVYTSYPFDYRPPSQNRPNQTGDDTRHDDMCPGGMAPNWTGPGGLWPPIRSWLGRSTRDTATPGAEAPTSDTSDTSDG